MKHKKEQQSQDTKRSTEKQSQVPEEKQLTLEDLASVTGGFLSLNDVLDASAKAEDRCGNKAEAE